MWTLKVPAKNIGTIGLVLTVKADNVKGAYLVLFSLGFFLMPQLFLAKISQVN